MVSGVGSNVSNTGVFCHSGKRRSESRGKTCKSVALHNAHNFHKTQAKLLTCTQHQASVRHVRNAAIVLTFWGLLRQHSRNPVLKKCAQFNSYGVLFLQVNQIAEPESKQQLNFCDFGPPCCHFSIAALLASHNFAHGASVIIISTVKRNRELCFQ